MCKFYGYVRVSTESQDCARQYEALNQYAEQNKLKYEKIYEDKISGKTFTREGFIELKTAIKSGDVLVVKELDRFGRNDELIKQEWLGLKNAGVQIVVVDDPDLNYNAKELTLNERLIKNLMFEIKVYTVALEREKISQRTKEALAIKKAEGKILGKKPFWTEENLSKLKELYQDSNLQIKEIAETMGVIENTIFVGVRKLVSAGQVEPRTLAFGVTRHKGFRKNTSKEVGSGGHTKKLTPEQTAEMLEKYFVQNCRGKDLMAEYGLFSTSFTGYVRRAINKGLYEPKKSNFGQRRSK